MSPYNPGSTRRQTSKRFHSSLTSLGPTAGSLPPALSRSSPAASSPLCGGPRAAAPPSRLSAMGVAGLDSCVILLLFLQRPLILRSGLHHPGQPRHLQHLHLLRLLLQGAGQDSQHQDQDRQIVFRYSSNKDYTSKSQTWFRAVVLRTQVRGERCQVRGEGCQVRGEGVPQAAGPGPWTGPSAGSWTRPTSLCKEDGVNAVYQTTQRPEDLRAL